MKLIDTDSKEQFLKLIEEEFACRQPVDQVQPLTLFTREYFEAVPIEEIKHRRLADIYGALVASWQFLQEHHPDQPKVRVFNPDQETHGWQSTHTVVVILHQNMPFLMDTVRMELNRQELTVHTILHGVLCIDRDARGNLNRIIPRNQECKTGKETLIYFEIDRQTDSARLEALRSKVEDVLNLVRTAMVDYERVRQIALDLAVSMADSGSSLDGKELEEAGAFLKWMAEGHFIFFGYEQFEIRGEGAARTWQLVEESRLGVRQDDSARPPALELGKMPEKIRNRLLLPEAVLCAKSPQRSRIHRPSYTDVVLVKRFNESGEVTGCHRFIGLYSASVYQESPHRIPMVRRKVAAVLERSGLDLADYSGRELDQILSVYPRDELFQIDRDELYRVAMSVLNIQERHRIRLFLREDIFGRFVSALVYVPRDIYHTGLRIKMSRLLMDELNATGVEFTTFFSESVLARTLFTLQVLPAENWVLKEKELEERIRAIAQSWTDGLRESLYETFGEEQASAFVYQYEHAFSASYRDAFSPRRAALDIGHMAALHDGLPLALSFYRALEEPDRVLHLKLFHLGGQLPLSDVLPVFENLGLRVMGEHPYETVDCHGRVIWIHDFSLESFDGRVVDVNDIRQSFEDLFLRVWSGEGENDSFNRLVLAACMDWRQIAVLRAYARYMRQIRISYSQDFIAGCLVSNVDIARMLLQLFEVRFDPDSFQSPGHSSAVQKKLEADINEALEAVENLSEDRIIRRYTELIRATLRTNFYQRDEKGQPKPYISFKFCPADISEMPLPLPLYEIFVYSPRVEGVHLRGGKVARGGLRWSDRFEDYRTEVLGLVKAQQVKNAVIVPVGAKGGFVAKHLPDGDRDAIQKEGIACYRTFIRGLLDLTDNLVGKEVVPPPRVVRHDPDDTYLVVAADKGTASFSDIANELSAEYNFWLGDAFASGGSHGYDHKKMGITARGAWVSVERHFREIGINTREQDFTVVGIGDMSGDVFGNGMLRSQHIRLVAAFNHLHIFIDPNPDAATSFQERERLFNLPRSSWADYDSSLISEGGGVFSRTQKSIPISPQMKERFGIVEDRLPPNRLISALLKAPVDLLWNGGIGTYIKSSQESHTEVGDKANDGVRVDARDLRCKVIGEGGNLGMTQLGRIEYGLEGGRLNTDFIDNAGGVDCSDHEVNIKIMLNEMVAEGDMTEKQRNQLLLDMTDEVAALVLQNNYRQTQAISIAESEAAPRIGEYRRLINDLELSGRLNRALEFIPDDETILERKAKGRGLTRPELSILFSYVKGGLKEALIDSPLADDEYMARELRTAFPPKLIEHLGDRLNEHRLRCEIIATQVANDMVNRMGITFVDRLRLSTGASVGAIARSYVIARDIFDLDKYWRAIEELDYQVPSVVQVRMMNELTRLIRRACRWVLRNRRCQLELAENIERFAADIRSISSNWPVLLRGGQLEFWNQQYNDLVEQGVPEDLAVVVAAATHLYSALGIVDAHLQTGAPLQEVADLFFAIGERLELQWFAYQINNLSPGSLWQALAREAFREDLDWQQRALTVGVLRQVESGGSVAERVDRWAEQQQELIQRWNSMLTELKAAKVPEFAMFSVALRELLDIAQSTTHTGTSEEAI